MGFCSKSRAIFYLTPENIKRFNAYVWKQFNVFVRFFLLLIRLTTLLSSGAPRELRCKGYKLDVMASVEELIKIVKD